MTAHVPPGLELPSGIHLSRGGTAITRHAKSFGGAVLDLLLPPHCPSCGAQITTHGTFCMPCFTKLSFITEPLCTGCGRPFASRAFAGPLRLCSDCLTSPPAWRHARAALLYDDASKTLIVPLKYADRQENAAVLGAQMARAGAALLAQADLLVPVPLHRRRLLARGFNQSVLLARALSRGSNIACAPDALQRVRATPSLGEFSGAARAAIMENAIAVRPKRAALIAGRRVLLIDDVMTTGATAQACARALLDAGAAHIDVLVACRTSAPQTES